MEQEHPLFVIQRFSILHGCLQCGHLIGRCANLPFLNRYIAFYAFLINISSACSLYPHVIASSTVCSKLQTPRVGH